MADEIIEEFLVESSEGLERIERDLVALEEDPTASDVVDRIFRDVHTIKGVCGFLGFHNLERVTHAGESLLSKVRAGDVAVCEKVISALLATVDAIRQMVELVERTGSDGDEPYQDIVGRLESLTEQDAETPDVEGDRPDTIPPLGEVLVTRGVSEEAVTSALEAQEEGDPRRLGEILVRREQAPPLLPRAQPHRGRVEAGEEAHDAQPVLPNHGRTRLRSAGHIRRARREACIDRRSTREIPMIRSLGVSVSC